MRDVVDYRVAETSKIFRSMISFYGSALCSVKCRKLIMEVSCKIQQKSAPCAVCFRICCIITFISRSFLECWHFFLSRGAWFVFPQANSAVKPSFSAVFGARSSHPFPIMSFFTITLHLFFGLLFLTANFRFFCLPWSSFILSTMPNYCNLCSLKNTFYFYMFVISWIVLLLTPFRYQFPTEQAQYSRFYSFHVSSFSPSVTRHQRNKIVIIFGYIAGKKIALDCFFF